MIQWIDRGYISALGVSHHQARRHQAFDYFQVFGRSIVDSEFTPDRARRGPASGEQHEDFCFVI